MRILQVIAPAPMGGAETVVLGLAQGLAADGHRIHVAAIVGDDADHPFVRSCREGGLEVAEIREGHRNYLAQARTLAAHLRSAGAHVVHTHGYHADVIGHRAARRLGVPLVSTLHGFTGAGLRSAIYDAAVRFVHRRSAAMVAVSTPIAERLLARGVRRERIHRIPNAWQPSATPLSRQAARGALGIPDGQSRFCWIGRLSAEKGADIALAALAGARRTDLHISFIGDGPERSTLKATAAALGITERVHWHGFVPDAARLLPAFDALVLSSRTEGSPMVLHEAMASRVPIVAAEVGGVPEMLTEAEGSLVPAESPAQLALALSGVLDDTTRTWMRVEAAHARLLREFSYADWIARHASLYEAVVGASGRDQRTDSAAVITPRQEDAAGRRQRAR